MKTRKRQAEAGREHQVKRMTNYSEAFNHYLDSRATSPVGSRSLQKKMARTQLTADGSWESSRSLKRFAFLFLLDLSTPPWLCLVSQEESCRLRLPLTFQEDENELHHVGCPGYLMLGVAAHAGQKSGPPCRWGRMVSTT